MPLSTLNNPQLESTSQASDTTGDQLQTLARLLGPILHINTGRSAICDTSELLVHVLLDLQYLHSIRQINHMYMYSSN